MIKVMIYAPEWCSKKGLPGSQVIHLKEGTTLRTGLKTLGINPILAKALILVVNGERKPLGTELKDGDRISVLPQISGG